MASNRSTSPPLTIVRQVTGGRDPADHRFVILSETSLDDSSGRNFEFHSAGIQMTHAEAHVALVAYGLSEQQARALILDAQAGFAEP